MCKENDNVVPEDKIAPSMRNAKGTVRYSKKGPQELIDLYESLMADKSLTWVKRLETIIEWKRKNEGLIGCPRPFVDPFKSPRPSVEDIAHDMFMMQRCVDRGEAQEVDVTDLDL